MPNGLPDPASSVEANGVRPQPSETAEDSSTSPAAKNEFDASTIPLYEPPAPAIQSPSSTKKQPLTNGIHALKSREAVSTTSKRKRDSISEIKGGKNAKVNGVIAHAQQGQSDVAVADGNEDQESMELARMLQQEERGLRRRSSRS